MISATIMKIINVIKVYFLVKMMLHFQNVRPKFFGGFKNACDFSSMSILIKVFLT